MIGTARPCGHCWIGSRRTRRRASAALASMKDRSTRVRHYRGPRTCAAGPGLSPRRCCTDASRLRSSRGREGQAPTGPGFALIVHGSSVVRWATTATEPPAHAVHHHLLSDDRPTARPIHDMRHLTAALTITSGLLLALVGKDGCSPWSEASTDSHHV